MKKARVFYWVFTLLFAFLMAGSAIPDVLSDPIAVKGMHQELGYPLYFIPFIGVAKLLGVIALLIPGFHRIKEWAYAGLAYDLIGATYSIITINPSVANISFMVVPISLGVLSYVYFRKMTKMEAGANTETVVIPSLKK